MVVHWTVGSSIYKNVVCMYLSQASRNWHLSLLVARRLEITAAFKIKRKYLHQSNAQYPFYLSHFTWSFDFRVTLDEYHGGLSENNNGSEPFAILQRLCDMLSFPGAYCGSGTLMSWTIKGYPRWHPSPYWMSVWWLALGQHPDFFLIFWKHRVSACLKFWTTF